MKFSIKPNKSPNLEVPEMVCDVGLGDHLNQWELTKFLNAHSINLFLGKPGSGKTSLLYSFFKAGGKNKILKKTFHNIYAFIPSHSRASLKDNIFAKLPEDKLYDELTSENLSDVLAKIKNSEPYEKNCIIFDDMTAFLKNADTKQLFKELVYNRRHLHTSIFFLCQSWLAIERDLRKLFTNLFVFKVSKSEMEYLFSETIEQKKDYMLDIMKIAYDKPHQFLFINTDSGRLFKCWDEIIINDDDEKNNL